MRRLPIAIALLVVLGAGVVRGVWTNRWTTSRAVEEAAARLPGVPLTIGPWKGEEEPFDAKEYARAGIMGGLLRRYTNTETGSRLSVLIVCGPPGPISVHTPDVCYRGSGFDQILPEELDKPTNREDVFRWLRMKKQNTVIPEYLGIHYSWSPSGTWFTPPPGRDARLIFAANPYLYKLYVVRDQATAEGSAEADEVRSFLGVFLPAVNGALFPENPSAEKPGASS